MSAETALMAGRESSFFAPIVGCLYRDAAKLFACRAARYIGIIAASLLIVMETRGVSVSLLAVMNPIAEICARLSKHPGIPFTAQENSIEVAPADGNGFWVGLYVSENQFTVAFSGWHETFSQAPEAVECFGFGLSQNCRLRVMRRGKKECRWTVEHLENNTWREDSTTGLIFQRFWVKPTVSVLQNNWLSLREAEV